MKTTDTKKKIEQKLRRVDDLPTLPSVASRIIALSGDPSASASDMTEIISLDQSLTAKILNLVNSTFYGFPEKIGTVNHAVVILGFNEVRNLALAASVFDTILGGGSLTFSKEALWRHSAACAAVSRMLARELGEKETGTYFVAGLLHDIGLVFLAAHLPEETEEIIRMASAGRSAVVDIENEVLGTDHADIGGRLTERWRLPSEIREAVRCHHRPELAKENPALSAVVSLANTLCHVKGIDWVSGLTLPIDEGAWEILKKIKRDLDEGLIDRFLDGMDKEMEGIDEFMGLLD